MNDDDDALTADLFQALCVLALVDPSLVIDDLADEAVTPRTCGELRRWLMSRY
jgi:hypothetical protein